jgi:hypothetical protein
MPKMSKTLLAINVFTVAIILSAALNAYLIRSDAGGYALWNAKEAYFFIGQDMLGRHVKWIEYPLLAAGEMFGYIAPPDDSRGTMFILRVTSNGVEHHVLNLPDRRQGSGPSMYTPRDGRIWVNWPTIGGLCWWAGDHFERATPEEDRKLDGIGGLNNAFYDDRNGWSKHGLGGAGSLEVKLGDETELLVYGGGESGRDPISIDMRKQGGEPRTIFELDQSVGLVSRSEYRKAFTPIAGTPASH